MEDDKKPSIKDFLKDREKLEVATSIGPMYVRHLTYGDYEKVRDAIASADDHEVGRQVVQILSSPRMDRSDTLGLSESEFSELHDEDMALLAAAAAVKSGFDSSEDTVAGLGKAVITVGSDLQSMSQKISDQFKNNLSFLKPDAIASLTSSVAAITNANLRWQKSFPNNISELGSIGSVISQGATHLHKPKINEDMPEYNLRIGFPSSPEARAADAAEKSAATLSAVAVHMGEMLNHVATLSTTLVSEVIPQWVGQRADDQAKADASLKGAAKSLWWTKWAVIISVVTSIGIAVSQGYLASVSSQESALLAKKREVEWSNQIEINEELLRRQILETQYLRSELNELNSRLEIIRTPVVTPEIPFTNSK